MSKIPDPGETHKINQPSVEMTGKIACAKCGLHVGAGTAVCPNDGTVLLNVSSLAPKLTGEYEFICEIGSGGMGVIYKARHMALNQMVAIKMLHSNRLNEASFRRFQQEARAISSLDHPGIVRVRDFGVTDGGQPHLILDYIQGDTLASYVSREGPLSVSDAIDIFIDVADALEHAHERGILHRDLKPSNIMLILNKGRFIVKIVDFGIAKMLDENEAAASKGLTQTGEVFGSPLYMSPEQASGEILDFRSDIYSLGCVIFEALTGTPPFASKSAIEILFQQLNDAPPSLKEASLGKSFPPELELMVAKALRKKRNERFKSMSELKDALIESRLGKRHQSLTVDAYQTKKPRDDSKLIWICASCLILAAGLAAWSFFGIAQVKPDAPVKLAPANAFEKLPTSDDAATEKILASKAKTKIKLGGWVNDEALAAFDHCTITEDVDLSGTSINGEGLDHLIHLPLRKLNLRHSGLTDVGLMKIGKMTGLQDLNIRHTQIKETNLEQLTRLVHLKKLNLRSTNTGDMGLESIAQIHSLESLNIADNDQVTTLGIDTISKMPNLKELDISKGQFESFLMTPAKFRSLQVLSLTEIDISKMGKSILTHLLTFPLQTLKMHKAIMSNEQFASLAKLRKLTTIQISDSPAIYKAMLLDLGRLRPDLKFDLIKVVDDDEARFADGDF